MIRIDANVPIPESRASANISQALRALNVGDSFLIPVSWKLSSVRSIAYGRFKDRQFTIRADCDGLRHRIWRVS